MLTVSYRPFIIPRRQRKYAENVNKTAHPASFSVAALCGQLWLVCWQAAYVGGSGGRCNGVECHFVGVGDLQTSAQSDVSKDFYGCHGGGRNGQMAYGHIARYFFCTSASAFVVGVGVYGDVFRLFLDMAY